MTTIPPEGSSRNSSLRPTADAPSAAPAAHIEHGKTRASRSPALVPTAAVGMAVVAVAAAGGVSVLSGQECQDLNGLWGLQSVPTPKGDSVLAAVSGGIPCKGTLHVQTPDDQTLTPVVGVEEARYNRLALGWAAERDVLDVVATAVDKKRGIHWWRLDMAARPVSVLQHGELPGPGCCSDDPQNPCNPEKPMLPSSVAVANPGCGDGPLVAVSYSSEVGQCGGVRLLVGTRKAVGGKDALTLKELSWRPVPKGASRVRFFDADSDGDLDIVASQTFVDGETGEWGIVWPTEDLSLCSGEHAEERVQRLADPDALGKGRNGDGKPQCGLSVADFDVMGVRAQGAEETQRLRTRYALALSAHLQGPSSACWTEETHGGYAMLTSEEGRFLSKKPPAEGADPKSNQLMGSAIAFYDEQQDGVGVAASYWMGSFKDRKTPARCPAATPCAASTYRYPHALAKSMTQPLVASSEHRASEEALVQRVTAGTGAVAHGHRTACEPKQTGITLPVANVARVLAVRLCDKDQLDKCNAGAGSASEPYSLSSEASWVSVPGASKHDCIGVDYEYPVGPTIWLAASDNERLLAAAERKE